MSDQPSLILSIFVFAFEKIWVRVHSSKVRSCINALTLYQIRQISFSIGIRSIIHIYVMLCVWFAVRIRFYLLGHGSLMVCEYDTVGLLSYDLDCLRLSVSFIGLCIIMRFDTYLLELLSQVFDRTFDYWRCWRMIRRSNKNILLIISMISFFVNCCLVFQHYIYINDFSFK